MKLDNLISELCPTGVKCTRLGDVCDVLRGKRLTKAQLTDNDKYPVLHGGLTPMGYYSEFNRKAGTTIVVNTGNAGSVFYSDREFWSSDACFSLYPHNGLLDRYLFHFVLQNEPVLKGKIRTGAMPTIDALAVESLLIPLPPLAVQQEIVRILDSFTELTAELTARRKQYEHYKGLIFKHTFAHGTTKPLGDIATFSQGIQVEPKNQFYDMTSDRVRFLRIVDFVSENEPPRYIERPNSKYLKTDQELVMIRYGASAAGKVFMNHSGAIANNMFKINFHDGITPRFAMHYLSQTSIYLALNTSSGTPSTPQRMLTATGKAMCSSKNSRSWSKSSQKKS